MSGESKEQICTHVIFDVDGLLLDTESIYTEITSSFLKEYGKEFTMELKVKMMGKPELVALQLLLEETQLTSEINAQEAYNVTKEKKIQLFPKANLKPGAERLIRHLHSNKIPMALATGSGTFEYNLKTSSHQDLFGLISHAVKSDDPAVKRGKPHPDIFQVAASRFDPPPQLSKVLVFEDAPNGVQAARAAGMNVVMVPEHYVDKAKCTEANQILTSLENFDPSVWGLPPFS